MREWVLCCEEAKGEGGRRSKIRVYDGPGGDEGCLTTIYCFLSADARARNWYKSDGVGVVEGTHELKDHT